MYRVILGASCTLFRRLTTELQTHFGILCCVRERDGGGEKGYDSGGGNGGGRGRLHFNHRRRDARGVRVGMGRTCARVFRINWYPLGPPHPSPPSIPAHRPSSYDDTHPLTRRARSLLPHAVSPSPPPAPTSLLPPSPSSHADRVGFGEKKRAGIFLSIPPGSLFFTRFFLPFPRPSGPAASGFFFFFCLTSPPLLHRVQTPRFFFTQDSRRRGSRRGGARVKSARAERAPAATRPITYQNKTGFFTREFIFILFHFILSFFRCLMPSVRELFFSILTATFSVCWPFTARLSIQCFQNFVSVHIHCRFRIYTYSFCTYGQPSHFRLFVRPIHHVHTF